LILVEPHKKIVMRYLFSALLLIGSFLFFQQCGENTTKRFRSSGPSVTGNVGEILVICEQGIWDSEIKKYLDTNLTQFIMPYFPDVTTFELVHRTPSHFEQGVKRFRNTLFVTIDPNHKKDRADINKRIGVWATDQLVVDIVGKDYNQVLEACKLGLKAVHAEFDFMEWKRILKQFKSDENHNVQSEIKKNFGIDVSLPEGAKIVTKRTNFYRVEFPVSARPIEFVGSGTQEAGSIFSGIMIYQYDYKDSSQFALENLLMARVTMLKYNVPHETDGLFMGTQYAEMVYPEGNEMTTYKSNISGYEMRGMYVFTGKKVHSTGGAFWAFHFVHPKKKKLICVSGYVDAPSTASWTHPLRELQAVLKSVELVK
jgi:hypothetical protein